MGLFANAPTSRSECGAFFVASDVDLEKAAENGVRGGGLGHVPWHALASTGWRWFLTSALRYFSVAPPLFNPVKPTQLVADLQVLSHASRLSVY